VILGSLFSGIGGLERGLELAGLGSVAWQVERDPFARKVLAKHWPEVDRSVEDVHLANHLSLSEVDLVCGGFPCQDVSAAGKGAGLAGARSGLWYEFRRVVEELAPSCVVVENVASGARRWLPHVRRDLHMLGYRTRAIALSAFDVGAPHLRRRVFVLAADPKRHELREQSGRSEGESGRGARELGDVGTAGSSADATSIGEREPTATPESLSRSGDARSVAGGGGLGDVRTSGTPPHSDGEGESQPEGSIVYEWRRNSHGGGWTIEPPVCGVAHGVPRRVDRNRTLGNAVHPGCAYVAGLVLRDWIGR